MLFFVPIAIGLSDLLDFYASRKTMKNILSVFVILLLVGIGNFTFIRNFAWRSGESLWADAVEKAPDLFRTHHNLGKYYDDQGYKEKAIFSYEKALEQPAANSMTEAYVTYYNLARIYGERKDYEKALHFYNRSLTLNPNYSATYNNIASLMDRQGRYQLAYKYLIGGVKLDPNNAEINYNLALHFLKDEQPDRAIFHLNKSINLKKLRDRVLLYLGVAYKQKGQLGRAATYFEKALKEKPRNINPHLHLAEVFYRSNDYSRAKKEVEYAVHLIQEKDTFDRIVNDLQKKGARSSRLSPSSTIIMPMMRDAYLSKAETLNVWAESLNQRVLSTKKEK
jgi:tetratricopeptide (TPR) repeat protein